MMKPNFICPGAQKAATSSFFLVLKQHKDIFLPSNKEPHFFDKNYDRGVDWYVKTFYSNYSNETIVGDITPDYLENSLVPNRIKKTIGSNIKFVFILRDPIERAYSNYWMNWNRGFEKKKFSFIVNNWSPNKNESVPYIGRGCYAKHIKNYLECFERDKMYFLLFEDYINDPEKYTIEILKFFGISTLERLNFNIKANERQASKYQFLINVIRYYNLASLVSKKIPLKHHQKIKDILRKTIYSKSGKKNNVPEINERIRIKLEQIYSKDIKDLEEITGLNLNRWHRTNN